MGSSRVNRPPRGRRLGRGRQILDFYARQGGSYPMRVGQLSESDAVDALRLPFYSSRHPTGSHVGGTYLIWGIPIYRGLTLFEHVLVPHH